MTQITISPKITKRHQFNDTFTRVYEGDLGIFFDPLATVDVSGLSLFPKLESRLRRMKSRWDDIVAVNPNVVKGVAETFSTFVLGEGAIIEFEDEQAGIDFYKDFWNKHNVASMVEEAHKISITSGISGVRVMRIGESRTMVRPFVVKSMEIYPVGNEITGYSADEFVIFKKILETNEFGNETGVTYYYTVEIVLEDDRYRVRHRVFSKEFNGVLSNEVPEVLSKFGMEGLVNGYEPVDYDSSTFSVLRSPNITEGVFGESIFKDSLSQIQSLISINTEIMLELQEHGLSKVSIPASALDVVLDQKGADGIGHHLGQYFVYDDDGAKPEYLQKNNSHIDYYFTQLSNLYDQIAFQVKVPRDTLDSISENGNQKMETAIIKMKPFEKMVKSMQNTAIPFIEGVVNAYYASIEEEVPVFSVSLPSVFDDNLNDIAENRLMEFKEKIISPQLYLKETRPDWSEERVAQEAGDALEYTRTLAEIQESTRASNADTRNEENQERDMQEEQVNQETRTQSIV